MSQAIGYKGSNIVIEQAPLPLSVRIMFGLAGSLGLILGLKGMYEIVRLVLGYGTGSENIPIGLIVTFMFTALPLLFLWAVSDSGKTLVLDPRARLAHLTKRYPFKITEKRFPLSALNQAEIYQDDEFTSVWSVRLTLPDRTRIEFRNHKNQDMKSFAKKWRETLNDIIAPA